MPPEIDPKIIELLQQYANQGLTFYQAKQELLRQGYQDEAIEIATDDYQYGSKPNKTPDPVTIAFEKDPKDAKLVAEIILKDNKKEREKQAIVDGVAGQEAPDIQSDLKYQNNFLADIGMSWWTWLIIEIIVAGIIFWFKLPLIYYGIIMLILVVVLAIKKA